MQKSLNPLILGNPMMMNHLYWNLEIILLILIIIPIQKVEILDYLTPQNISGKNEVFSNKEILIHFEKVFCTKEISHMTKLNTKIILIHLENWLKVDFESSTSPWIETDQTIPNGSKWFSPLVDQNVDNILTRFLYFRPHSITLRDKLPAPPKIIPKKRPKVAKVSKVMSHFQPKS